MDLDEKVVDDFDGNGMEEDSQSSSSVQQEEEADIIVSDDSREEGELDSDSQHSYCPSSSSSDEDYEVSGESLNSAKLED